MKTNFQLYGHDDGVEFRISIHMNFPEFFSRMREVYEWACKMTQTPSQPAKLLDSDDH